MAFWLRENDDSGASAAIVHLDSEGGQRVVAACFDDFLARLVRRKTGVPDIDEADTAITLPAALNLPRNLARIPPGLNTRLEKWLEQNLDRHTPATSSAASLEKLRKKLHALAAQTLRDGFNTVYKIRDWWQVDLRAARENGELQITYLDRGDWKPLPAAYGAEPLFRELLTSVKHPKRAAYEIIICKSGLVSVERDRELVLEPVQRE